MDGPFLADTLTPLLEAARIARYLIREDPDHPFVHVAQARIVYLLQQPTLMLHGEPVQAYIARATVQGPNHLLWAFLLATRYAPKREQPYPLDWIVYVDKAAWDRAAWRQERGASGFPIVREALIYHELTHLRQLETADGEPRFTEDGRPLLALRRHDYEFFDSEIRRYGPATLELVQAALSLAEGARTEHKRERRGKLRAV